MSETKINKAQEFLPTPQQQSVIDDNAPALVVSASAGSGKTSTMIKRVIRLIEGGQAKLSEILILTFTIAAAADMRSKLYEALSAKAGTNKNCSDALFAVSMADISTIDAFCKKVVSEFFYIANVNPGFRIMDEMSQDLLKERACKNVLNRYFRSSNADFFLFIQNNFEKRNDKQIKKLVYDVFAFLCTSDNRDNLANCTKQSHNEDLSSNSAAKIIMEHVQCEYNKLAKKVEDFGFRATYKPTADFCVDISDALKTIAKEKDFEKFFAFVKSFNPSTNDIKPQPKKNTPQMEEKKELTQLLGESYMKKHIPKFFVDDSIDDIKRLLQLGLGNANFLLELTHDFEKEYTKIKKEKNMLEFGDIEALCQEILKDDAARCEVTKRYKFVLVDEFQDINGMQDAIIKLLSSSGKVFTVGDVKQSIYGFRLTDSKIFEKRFKDACKGAQGGKAFNLSANFRSTRRILEFNNAVFGKVMTEQNCSIEYASEGGGRFESLDKVKEAGRPCEVLIVKKEKAVSEKPSEIYSVARDNSEFDDAPYARAEAKIIANIIIDLRQQGLKDGDITILCRAKNEYVREVCAQLERYRFKLNISFDNDLTENSSVSYLHSLLNVVNNFKNDIDLVSVMLSPIFSFAPQEMMDIRAAMPDETFFHQCVLACESEKVKNMLSVISDLFEYAKSHSVFEVAEYASIKLDYFTLINKVLGDEEAVKNYLSALKNAPIDSLSEYAAFTKNAPLTSKTAQASEQGKINIATIHSSKGLEYDAVILIGAGKGFNEKDLKSSSFVNGVIGIASKGIDADEDEKKVTIAGEAAKILKQKEMTAEEIRILYVALTRAKKRLFVTGACEERIVKKTGEEKFDSIVDIILRALDSDQKAALLEKGQTNFGECAKVFAFDAKEIAFEGESAETYILPKLADTKLKESFEKSIQNKLFADGLAPSKTSVSRVINDESASDRYAAVQHPVFLSSDDDQQEQERRILEGNAYHKFFEQFDYETGKTGIIPPGVEPQHIDAFLISDLPKIAKDKKVLKEQKFILRLENGSLMQGIIDLILIEKDGFTIVDFKVTDASAAHAKIRYKTQIDLYARATEQILQIKCKKRYIYLVKHANLVEICE